MIVVSVNSIDGDHIAAILTDGMNTEIQCNVSHLQTSSEVTTGHGHLMGYVRIMHLFQLFPFLLLIFFSFFFIILFYFFIMQI